MVRMVILKYLSNYLQNTLPFRLLCKNYGADHVFSEEIIDRKFHNCVRLENEEL